MTNAQAKAILDHFDQLVHEARNTLLNAVHTGTTVSPTTYTLATRELTAPGSLTSVTLEFSDTLGGGSDKGVVLTAVAA